MRVLDLFSGIGGFSLGLERAGMETIAFCEMDKHCQAVLKKHWPHVPVHDDVKKLKGKDFKNIDVICGGFPCQDISVAGNKKGFKHDGKRTRSGLWEEFKRIIKEFGPRYAIIENVANLRSLGLNQVIKDLWSIGYACEWHIISARSIGACHLRERVWIIAYPYSDRRKEGLSLSTGNKRESLLASRVCSKSNVTDPNGNELRKKQELKQGEQDSPIFRNHGENEFSTDTDMPRFWRTFTSEKAASGWWAETTSRFSDVFRKIHEIESTVCRGDDGISDRLDERARKERVKQLGNSVVPQIPQIIGECLMNYEKQLKF